MPSIADRDPRYGDGCDHGAHGCPCIKEPRCKGTFTLWKLVCNGFDGGWEVTRLSQTKSEARHTKSESGPHQCMSQRGNTPNTHDERVAQPRAKSVYNAARAHQANGIGHLEAGDDGAIRLLGEPDLLHQSRLENADDLPVHVVNCGGDKEHGAHRPPNVAG